MNHFSIPLEVKALDDTGTFEGVASVFSNEDLAHDVVLPGAFTSSIVATQEVPLLWCHDQSEVIGAIREMEETATGLRVKGEIALETTRGKEAHQLLKRRMLKGLSIGYLIVKDYVSAGKHFLKEVSLKEISLVPVPMNPLAQVTNVKSQSGDKPNINKMEHIELAKQIGDLVAALNGAHADARKQLHEQGEVSDSLKKSIETIQADLTKLNEKMTAVETKFAKPILGGGTAEYLTVGDKFVNSAQFKSFQTMGRGNTGTVAVGNAWHTKAITSLDTGGNVWGPKDRDAIVGLPQQRLYVRDLVNVSRTGAAAVEYPKQASFTNNAGPFADNTTMGASDMAFTLAIANVKNIGHFAKAAKSILNDLPQLVDFINGDMLYGLRLKEEWQIVNGDNTGQNLNGIVNQATAYDTNLDVVGDTVADKILHACYQVSLTNYVADAILVHPSTVHALLALKTTGTASSGQYIFGNPAAMGAFAFPTIWGLPLVGTLSVTTGAFVVGAFRLGATLYDREDATVFLSTEDADNIQKGMVTAGAEERIALAVKAPAAFVTGAF